MKSDILISQESQKLPIELIAYKTLGLIPNEIELYGKYKAKVNYNLIYNRLENSNKTGKLILVTAITPTPAGEGKTTVSIGLADALRKLNKHAILSLREPSLGPVFGIKGGATGGGYSQVIPMDDINLHFTGDIHAISAANNLLASIIDNHIFHGNELRINPKKITWRRCLDMNDRQLRFIVNGLGPNNGIAREDSFDITAASEIMAIICLASDIADLKRRISNIIIGYNYKNQPIFARDLKAENAMTVLLKDAIKPNLVQTLEHTPAFIHGGPFANIAHGCSSVIATKLGLKLCDFVVTEAGFGADLGAEKFLDIKCRHTDLIPDAVVLVATIRALKYHGGSKIGDLGSENLEALNLGFSNLLRHLNNLKYNYNLQVIVAINKFNTDLDSELIFLQDKLLKLNINYAIADAWKLGSAGCDMLAQNILNMCDACDRTKFSFCYDLGLSIYDKIKAIATKIYHATDIKLTSNVISQIQDLETLGFNSLPICIAKTQYSFSDNPKLLNAPEDFILNICDIKVSAGAEFLVVLTSNIITMPGLPKIPNSERIDILDSEIITGLS
ncbi:MAG: formate--tetrahydrofolate ligase [Candidatus Improbicoccus devescovinae]|nr:MAG: formate--tetrahydrofolate ligase [Candidatus Improbicoccus devescovinae]